MTKLGAVFLPYLPPERLRGVAVAADDAGLDELWLWEDCFRESGVAAAAAALAWTGRLRLGLGLLPVPLRNVALTAPYFHTGQAWDLKLAVSVMGTSQLGARLTSEEIDKVTSFLDSLTGEQPQVTFPVLPPSVGTTPTPEP